MDIVQAQQAIAQLNQDFGQLPIAQLMAIEDALNLSGGQISSRRYTLPGDTQHVRDEIRQHLLNEAAWCQSYLEPDGIPPAAINATAEEISARKTTLLALATQIRR